jgi:hypothetical protein
MNKRTFLLALGALAARPAFALYDGKPDVLLADMAGAWEGTLTYRDYQPPGAMVTLPTRMTVALTAPHELALYYVFDDGPGKTVYSYERMAFDFPRSELVWVSGVDQPERSVYQVTAAATTAGRTAIAFKDESGKGMHRFSLDVTRQSWRMMKFEQDAAGSEFVRNTFEFARA